MMKTIFLFVVIMITMIIYSPAQTLEHFSIESYVAGWRVRPTFDERPQSGVNGTMGDESGSIRTLIKTAVKTLPGEIKRELVKQDVAIDFVFNPKGEIFYISFLVRKKGEFFMTDKQWLKVYYTFRNLKVDVSKLQMMENFEWGSGGMYPISKFLQQQAQ